MTIVQISALLFCCMQPVGIYILGFSHTALTNLQHQIKQQQNKTDREMAALENTIMDGKNTTAQRHTLICFLYKFIYRIEVNIITKGQCKMMVMVCSESTTT